MNAFNSNSVTPFQEQSPATGITASVVPDRQRLSFWPTHFGSIPQWIILKPRIFAGWTASVMSTAVVSGPFTRSAMAARLWLPVLTVTINGICSMA